ncbi:AbrB/MazE/SpoVT family DNA-binding domain-containing protein [Endozoicomonas sp.]|uniref:AbrB/MazE/SpoVT family DNA-binding domain-containing protein n=1 Tax=Endozoicomonas sp. TaxID=1892382 RepID=UPI002887C6BC|nr:AbrB/MazE/SpoVT family DNA-binding domain-containing protein [Endozoicomonas sp.]
MQTEIKKWGNSAAVRLPAKVLAMAGLEVESSIEILVINGEIILKPVRQDEEYSLEDLLSASPDKSFDLDDDDKRWLNDTPKGEELL